MGKSRVDPRKYGMSRNQVKGSWWFVVKGADGTTSLCHYSPSTLVENVILKNGGDPELTVARYGSKVLENNKCLEEYRINLNGSTILGDHCWDGKLALITITSKGMISSIRSKFSKKSGSSGSSGDYDLQLYEASGLRGVDKSGTSDPYVVFSFADGGHVKSSTKKKNLNPTWGSENGEALSLKGPPLDTAVLKIQVYDSNVIQKDVLLGEAEVNLAQLHKEIHYNTFSVRHVLVPLSPQGWVRFGWKTADQKYSFAELPLILEPSYGFSSIDTKNEFPDWSLKKKTVVAYHSSLSGAIRFLENKLFAQTMSKTPNSVLKIAAQFGEADSWKDLQARFTPELLGPVGIFALEVKPGHGPEEVSALLQVVKDTPSIGEVHLLDFDRSDAMEHGIEGLKGAPHVIKLKYSDDQEDVNDDGVKSLTELLPELPALESLELTPSKGMLHSSLLPGLFETIARLKAKSVTLTDLPSDSETVDLSTLIKTSSAESLAIRFKTTFSFKDSAVWNSIVGSLKESGLRRIEVDHYSLTSEATEKLVESVLQMPSVEELKFFINSNAFKTTIPLLTKLKGLSVRFTGNTKVHDLLSTVAANQTLERLQLEGDLDFPQTDLRDLAKDNTTLKVLIVSVSISAYLCYCDSSVLPAFESNTSLQSTVLDIYKIYDSSFTDKIKKVNQTWKQRGATFTNSYAYL